PSRPIRSSLKRGAFPDIAPLIGPGTRRLSLTWACRITFRAHVRQGPSRQPGRDRHSCDAHVGGARHRQRGGVFRARPRRSARTGPVETVADAAKVIDATVGYPVAIKAAGGGGGKGFRVAESEGELEKAFDGASREGEKFFSDPTVYIERYLPDPRHVEVQVL